MSEIKTPLSRDFMVHVLYGWQIIEISNPRDRL